ncbi:hypothetical protein [Corynebacterium lizhenjunii]|uniref:hypothetical protein n=1 Tax=Corynebacterium lizhenjunii TaxID=2709394 RepID=UPI0013EBDCA5|nr:hypothetical protein [Corynebacterium lizhenjunii]
MNEPDRPFWIEPYIYDDGTQKYPPHFPSISGVTLRGLRSHPPGTILHQTWDEHLTDEDFVNGKDPLLWNSTTAEEFKHIPSHHRDPDCVAE